jgi:hypothetical protein
MSFDAALSLFSPRFRAGGCGCADCPGCGQEVGALERRNPLPPARYWADVFAPDLAAFQAWVQANAGVKVVSTQEFPDESPSRTWFLFDVMKSPPVNWQGPGLPSIADPGVTSSSDTAQRPDPTPGIATQVEQMTASITQPLGGVVVVLAGAAAVGIVLAFAKAGR